MRVNTEHTAGAFAPLWLRPGVPFSRCRSALVPRFAPALIWSTPLGSRVEAVQVRFLLGSFSQAVALLAGCSVEIVRSPKMQRAEVNSSGEERAPPNRRTKVALSWRNIGGGDSRAIRFRCCLRKPDAAIEP